MCELVYAPIMLNFFVLHSCISGEKLGGGVAIGQCYDPCLPSKLNILKVKEALAKGGNVNSEDTNGETALKLAVKYGSAEVVQVLLDSPHVEMNSKTGNPSETPLQLAVRLGNKTIVQLLINDQRVDVNITDKECNSPLHDAAKRGHNRIVFLLLNHPQIKTNYKNKEGQTPLMSALVQRRALCVRDMLSHPKIDLDTKEKEGRGLKEMAR